MAQSESADGFNHRDSSRFVNFRSGKERHCKFVENLRHELIELPASAPEQNRLRVLDSLVFSGGGRRRQQFDLLR